MRNDVIQCVNVSNFVFHTEPMSATSSNSNECNLQNLNDEGMDDDHNDQTNGECSTAHSSAASSSPKDIKFNIHHKYTTRSVVVSDRSTIGV